MAQQPQVTSQVVFGPANQGGDTLHILNNANAIQGWVDKNNLSQGVAGVTNALAGGVVPATVSAAAASTAVFSTVPLNLPGNSAYEGVPFTVKATGWITLNGGTYTATVQPFIYGSTSLGFTASVAAAICSNSAASLTIAVAAAATLTTFPWEAELTVFGGTTTGVLGGRATTVVGPAGAIAPAPVTATALNSPTAINFASATTPVQFLVGVGILGATVSASTANLQAFFIES